MKKYIFLTVILFAANIINAGTKWAVDKSHSKVEFSVTHLVISEVTGSFKNFDVNVETPGNDFSDAQIDFTADVNSIFTDNDQRDNHLKSDDFFNAEKYPKMTFKGSSMKKVGKNKYKLTGDLTIRNTTKKIVLDVVYNGTVKDPWGNTKAGFKISGKLNRFDYGLKWNSLIETGGAVVGKEVTITINLELQKQA